MDDSAYQSQVSDLTQWLEAQKNRPDPLAGLYSDSESPMESESRTASKVEGEEEKDRKGGKEETGTEARESTDAGKTTGKGAEVSKGGKEEKAGSSKTEKEGAKADEAEKGGEKDTSKDAPPWLATDRSEASKERNFKFEQAIVNIFEAEYKPDLAEVMEVTDELQGDLGQTNNRLRTLAFILNDQLHSVRDKIFSLDHELKRMAKGVEFALLRAKCAGMNDLVSETRTKLGGVLLKTWVTFHFLYFW